MWHWASTSDENSYLQVAMLRKHYFIHLLKLTLLREFSEAKHKNFVKSTFCWFHNNSECKNYKIHPMAWIF